MQNEHIRRALIAETQGWSDEQKAALRHRLDREATRLLVARKYPTAGKLAQHVAPNTVQTPALELIDNEIEWALSTPNARLVISMPPQQGKTQRVGVWSILRALVQNPNRRAILASYSETLARSTSREARNWIATTGSTAADPITGAALPDKLGLALASDKSAAGNWQLAGHRGGLYATGVGGSLTGSACDYLVIDDPLKGMTEADSRSEREKIITWWESVAQTRLAPGAPVVIIATRWHEDDLTGHVLAQDRARPVDEREWRVVNIPAIATPGVPDALGREAGEPLQSARGTTLDDWHRIRANVGERVWSALYLGAPTPTEGGLFRQEWFDRGRVEELPDGVAARVVAVDPAETGKGDEAGVVALAVTADSRVWLTHDHSGQYTSDQWAREAVLLALRTNATELSFEAFVAGRTYEDVLLAAWRRVRRESQLLRAHESFAAAVAAYEREDVRPSHCSAALAEVDGVAVPDQPDPPFVIRPWRAKGDKIARAAGSRQAASTGRLRLVGRFDRLEAQACFPSYVTVDTTRGPVPISAVTPGMHVHTRRGPRRVLWSGKTGTRQLIRVHHDDGHLDVTDDHLLWTADGWTPAGELREGDTLTWLEKEPDRPKSSTASATGCDLTATTNATLEPRAAAVGGYSCTEKSGSTIMAPSPRATSSTTEITTAGTTRSATSNSCHEQLTTSATSPTELPPSAVSPATYFAKRVEKNGPVDSPATFSATTAEPRLSPLGSAPNTARPAVATTTTATDFASWNDSATPPKPVVRSTSVRSVEQLNGPKVDVYDLTVEGEHEFFADGVLAHNCTWQAGQSSPDRLDALVQGYERAVALVGGQAQLAVPGRGPIGSQRPSSGGSFWSSTVG